MAKRRKPNRQAPAAKHSPEVVDRAKAMARVVNVAHARLDNVLKASGAAAVLGDYPSASETRLYRGRRPRGGSDNSHADPITRDNLRRDSKSLARGNPDARSIAKRLADMLVGDGLVVKSTSSDAAWAKMASERFNEWMQSKAPDRLGLRTGWQLLYAAMKVPVTEGDGLFVKLADQTLQWIDAELIRNPGGTADTADMVGGAKIVGGRVVAYNVTEWNSSQTSPVIGGKQINARNVIYVSNIADDGINQVRSTPMIQACIRALGLVEDVETNTAITIAVATLVSAIIKTENPLDTQDGMEEVLRLAQDQESSGPRSIRMEPGLMKYLRPGESMEQFKTENPTTNVMEFNKAQISKCAADVGLSGALAQLDMTQMTASNAKALVSIVGRCLEHQASQPVNITRELYRWKIGGDIMAGEIPFVSDWDKVNVIPKAMPLPDLNQEIAASVAAIDNNLSTIEREAERLGMGDFDSIIKQRGKEAKAELENGVMRVLKPGAGPSAGAGAGPGSGSGGGQTSTDPVKK